MLKSQRLPPLNLVTTSCIVTRLISTKMAGCFVVGFVRNLYPITLTTVITLPGFYTAL